MLSDKAGYINTAGGESVVTAVQSVSGKHVQ